MNKLLLAVGSLLVASVLSACGSSGGGSNNNVGCNGVIVNGVCQPNGGVIVPPYGTTYKSGYYGPTSLMMGSNSGDGLRSFLRNAMGVCDVATWAWGDAKCDNWISGEWDVTIQLNSTGQLKDGKYPTYTNGVATFRVYPRLSGWNLSAGLYSPMGASCGVINNYPYCQISLQMTPNWINNYQGLEFRGYGVQGTASALKLVQIQLTDILTNKQDGTYNMKVSFPNNNTPYVILQSSTITRR